MVKSSCNFRYLRTPMGAVKVINIIFGATSLILVAASYAPLWTLAVFTGTVTGCLFLSLFYLAFYLLAEQSILHTKTNRVVSFIYHALAGTALVVAGIELIGWSEYVNPKCTHDCDRLYTVGIAKTLTFMNGTLYLIVGFLGIKDDDMLETEAADEDIPLLNSTKVIASIPGGTKPYQQNPFCFYDGFYRHNKFPFDDTRSQQMYHNYYHQQQHPRSNPPHNSYTAEYSFNNSYGSSNASTNGVHFAPNGRRPRSSSTSGHAHPVITAQSMPPTMTVPTNISFNPTVSHSTK